MASIKQTLVKAKEAIQDPNTWTQGRSARMADGKPTYPGDSDASCFCSVGAIEKVTLATGDKARYPLYAGAIAELSAVLFPKFSGIAQMNDSSSHGQVMAYFDRAIAAASDDEVKEIGPLL